MPEAATFGGTQTLQDMGRQPAAAPATIKVGDEQIPFTVEAVQQRLDALNAERGRLGNEVGQYKQAASKVDLLVQQVTKLESALTELRQQPTNSAATQVVQPVQEVWQPAGQARDGTPLFVNQRGDIAANDDNGVGYYVYQKPSEEPVPPWAKKLEQQNQTLADEIKALRTERFEDERERDKMELQAAYPETDLAALETEFKASPYAELGLPLSSFFLMKKGEEALAAQQTTAATQQTQREQQRELLTDTAPSSSATAPAAPRTPITSAEQIPQQPGYQEALERAVAGLNAGQG